DPTIRNKVFIITIVATAVTGLLSAIPYHFYDYTEARHEEIIKELEERAKQIEDTDSTVPENTAAQ
ncbi:MAG: hypothetical protein ACI4XE_02990, partial [Acutalibacteraceae bacterium]